MDPLRTLCPKRFTGVSLVRSNALWEDDGLDDIEGDDDDSLYKDMSDKLLHPRGSAPAAATSVKPAGRKEDPIEVSPVAQSNNPFSVFRHQSAKPLPNSNAASQHARPVPVSALVSKSLKITFAGTTTRVNEKQQPQRQGSPAVPVSLSDDSPKSSPSQALSKGKVSSSSNLGNAKKDANMHGKQKQRKVVLEGSDEESSDSDFDYRAKKQLGKRTAEKSADACTIESISLGDSPAAIPLRPPHTTATTAVDTGLEASPFVLTAKRRAKGPSGQGAVLEIADSDDDDEGRPTHGPSKGAARAGVALASNPATKPRQKRAYQMIDDEEPDDDDDDDDSTSSDSDAVVAAPRSAMAKVRLARGGGGGPGPPVDLLDDSSGGDDEDEDDVSIMGMGSLASNPAQAPRRRMARLGAARDDSNGGAAAAMGVKRLVKLRKAVNGGGGSENGSGSGAGSGSVAAIAVASSSEDKVDVSSASSSEGEGSDVEVSDGGHGREDSEGSVFDPLDIAMRKCEAIAFSLRKALGLHEEEEEGFRGCSELPPAAALVPASEMAEVCGGWHKTKPLKVYQLVGVNFMLLLHRNQVGGAILADEMGLGKTVQAISFMGMVHARDPRCGPFLVVAPASLLENWQRELSQWCPGLRVVLYHGGRRAELQDTLLRAHRRGDMADGDRSTRPFDVMLTCYSLFERDSQVSKDDRALLRKWRWSYMVLDEAHMLKDRNSMRWRKLSQVSAHARGRLMLTGTPLQNRAEELWHMLEFLLPETFAAAGRVDLSSIIEHFAKQSAPLAPPSAPLQKPSNPGPDGPSANGTLRRSAAGGKGETKAENLGGELLGGDPESSTDPFVQRMKKMLAPFVLRRTKADVMRELTPKTHVVEDVELLPGQREVYEGAVCTHLRARREGAALAANNIFTHLRKVGAGHRAESIRAGEKENRGAFACLFVGSIFMHLRMVGAGHRGSRPRGWGCPGWCRGDLSMSFCELPLCIAGVTRAIRSSIGVL
eukprot:jgi/Mesvir1/10886/Mv18854-RA.3